MIAPYRTSLPPVGARSRPALRLPYPHGAQQLARIDRMFSSSSPTKTHPSLVHPAADIHSTAETITIARSSSAGFSHHACTKFMDDCKLHKKFFKPNTHRRRDATKQFRLVGVGDVYWALDCDQSNYSSCIVFSDNTF